MAFLAALLPALIGGAASIAGAAVAKGAADRNIAATERATEKADQFMEPYRDAGTNALASLEAAHGLGDTDTLEDRRATLTEGFESSPLYQYTYQPAVDEAVKGVERHASASGQLNSGRTLKAIQDRAARIGGQTFGNYLSGLERMAGRGQSAASGSAHNVQSGTAAANQARTDSADAVAAGFTGVSNAAQGGVERYDYLKNRSAYGPNALDRYNYGV